ncbi:MAG: hypothetical protein CL512_01650 [Actinobacteria bacterium]|nr:hypothetical protein [Actinomycetota bacterium]
MKKFERSRLTYLSVFLVSLLFIAGCANSATPNSWEEQAVDGQGLAERNFIESCHAANEDLTEMVREGFCGCLLDGIKEAVTFSEFKKLDDHIKKHSNEITATGLGDAFPWFIEVNDNCAGSVAQN